MAEVLFYHLTVSSLDEALPGLLEKTVQRGWRAVVQASSPERRDALDQLLWTYRDDSFLAHGLDTEAHAAEQPVLLSLTNANVNSANVRFVVEGAPPPDFSGYARGVIMFDGHDDQQLSAARGQWRSLKEAGHAVTYWRQSDDGRWMQQA